MPKIGEMVTRVCVKCNRTFKYEYRGGNLRDLHLDTGPEATTCRMDKSNAERDPRLKANYEAEVERRLRAAVAERLREILPERTDELDRAHAFRLSPNGFILDMDEERRRRLLARLHATIAEANRLLAHERTKRDAHELLLAYRKATEEQFLTLLLAISELFDYEDY